ncbi:hypothetical protein K440DRAFT_657510 [Wilcoxina mikolae CBS 423.85]|nr:hypothetical protein K440DRAFT_657510 [Wilcoxina mikolae CBS 423.85]
MTREHAKFLTAYIIFIFRQPGHSDVDMAVNYIPGSSDYSRSGLAAGREWPESLRWMIRRFDTLQCIAEPTKKLLSSVKSDDNTPLAESDEADPYTTMFVENQCTGCCRRVLSEGSFILALFTSLYARDVGDIDRGWVQILEYAFLMSGKEDSERDSLLMELKSARSEAEDGSPQCSEAARPAAGRTVDP